MLTNYNFLIYIPLNPILISQLYEDREYFVYINIFENKHFHPDSLLMYVYQCCCNCSKSFKRCRDIRY